MATRNPSPAKSMGISQLFYYKWYAHANCFFRHIEGMLPYKKSIKSTKFLIVSEISWLEILPQQSLWESVIFFITSDRLIQTGFLDSYIFLYGVSVIESTSGRAKRACWLFSVLVVDPLSRLIPDQSTSHLFNYSNLHSFSAWLALPVCRCMPAPSLARKWAGMKEAWAKEGGTTGGGGRVRLRGGETRRASRDCKLLDPRDTKDI